MKKIFLSLYHEGENNEINKIQSRIFLDELICLNSMIFWILPRGKVKTKKLDIILENVNLILSSNFEIMTIFDELFASFSPPTNEMKIKNSNLYLAHCTHSCCNKK